MARHAVCSLGGALFRIIIILMLTQEITVTRLLATNFFHSPLRCSAPLCITLHNIKLIKSSFLSFYLVPLFAFYLLLGVHCTCAYVMHRALHAMAISRIHACPRHPSFLFQWTTTTGSLYSFLTITHIPTSAPISIIRYPLLSFYNLFYIV